MNDSKEHLFAAARMTFVEPEIDQRHQPDNEAMNTYIELTEKLQKPVEEIEKVLNEYYEQNKYFPRGKASLMKWNVLRQRESALVEVYFGGQNQPPLPHPPPPPAPQVLTYAMIGAPPTGPSGGPGHPGGS